MPNIVAHLFIAERLLPETTPDVYLGSIMPDFLGMYRDFRGGTLRATDLEQFEDVYSGVKLHYATDTAYDGLPARKELTASLRHKLSEIVPNISSGAVRACADAGNDILLDGVLAKGPGGKMALFEFKEMLLRQETSLAKIDEPELESMVMEHFMEDVALRYANPERVASMLYFRFMSRKRQRLAFEEDAIPAISEVFRQHIPVLKKASGLLMKQTVKKLS